jgi:hypothetical protein
MADILLAILTIASFAFGYYVTDLFGSFLDRHLRADPHAPDPAGRTADTERPEDTAPYDPRE